MTLEQTEAIVLRYFDYGEADRVVHFLTEKNGLVHCFVRGVRKLKSRFGGRIDLLNHGNLFYFEREQEKLSSVNDFELIGSFPTLKNELERFYRASIMAELANLVSAPSTVNRRLFKIFIAFMKSLDNPASHSRVLLVLFEIFIIHHEGYSPPFGTCSSCRKKPVFPMRWLPASNRFVCSDCGRGIQGQGLIIPVELNDTFKMMRNPNINSLVSTRLEDSVLARAERFCYEYLRFHLDFQARTDKMYRLLDHL